MTCKKACLENTEASVKGLLKETFTDMAFIEKCLITSVVDMTPLLSSCISRPISINKLDKYYLTAENEAQFRKSFQSSFFVDVISETLLFNKSIYENIRSEPLADKALRKFSSKDIFNLLDILNEPMKDLNGPTKDLNDASPFSSIVASVLVADGIMRVQNQRLVFTSKYAKHLLEMKVNKNFDPKLIRKATKELTTLLKQPLPLVKTESKNAGKFVQANEFEKSLNDLLWSVPNFFDLTIQLGHTIHFNEAFTSFFVSMITYSLKHLIMFGTEIERKSTWKQNQKVESDGSRKRTDIFFVTYEHNKFSGTIIELKINDGKNHDSAIKQIIKYRESLHNYAKDLEKISAIIIQIYDDKTAVVDIANARELSSTESNDGKNHSKGHMI